MLGKLGEAYNHADEAVPTCASPEMPESSLAYVAHLRAKAAYYRLLSDGLFDPSTVAVVQACALELESEATSIEKMETRRTALAT